MNTLYFDMDGTIADLYGVENWLELLQAENPLPYKKAAPLCNLQQLSKKLQKLQDSGWKIGIISWLSLDSSKEYKKQVIKAKKEWLKQNFSIKFDEIHIVAYGTRKDYVAKNKNGILFDDDEKVRKNWRGRAINPQMVDINCFLSSFV